MRAVVWITLFTANERAIDALMGRGGEPARTIRRQRRLELWRLRPGGGRRGDQLTQFGQKRLPPAPKFDLAQIAPELQHAIGKSLFVREGLEHPLLDSLFRNQINDGNRPGLVFAPGAR